MAVVLSTTFMPRDSSLGTTMTDFEMHVQNLVQTKTLPTATKNPLDTNEDNGVAIFV